MGDDVYFIQNPGDAVVEFANQGIDTVVTPFAYSLAGAHVENLTYAGTENLDDDAPVHAYALEPNIENVDSLGDVGVTLTGNGLNNALMGGNGADTFIAGGGDDVINGRGGLDIASCSGNRGAYTITRGGGFFQVASSHDGLDVLTGVERVEFGDGGFEKLVNQQSTDFDGDGRDDILWRNIDGRVAIWKMDGFIPAPRAVDVSAPIDWRIAGTGDFNGDGKTDLLWRHTSGAIGEWQMDGYTAAATGRVGIPSPNDWQILSRADFNGDGKTDVLWRHDSG